MSDARTIIYKSFADFPYGNVIVISPHPDDSVLGCGGLLVNLSRKRKDISLHVFVLTPGYRGVDVSWLETHQAAAREAVCQWLDIAPERCTTGPDLTESLKEKLGTDFELFGTNDNERLDNVLKTALRWKESLSELLQLDLDPKATDPVPILQQFSALAEGLTAEQCDACLTLVQRLANERASLQGTCSCALPVAARMHLPLDRFAVALELLFQIGRETGLEWDKVRQLDRLIGQAVLLRERGTRFRAEVILEKGHYKTQQVTDYNDIYSSGPTYERVYVMDSPQIVRLVTETGEPILSVESKVLDHLFLIAAGVIMAAEGAYWQETELEKEREKSWSNEERSFRPEEVRNRIAAHVLGENTAFDLTQIGLLDYHYPLVALGQAVVISVHESGRKTALPPVETILLRGEIRPGLSYEVIPRSEFDKLLDPDGLTDWDVPAQKTSRGYRRPWEPPATFVERRMQCLRARNWNWRLVESGDGELTQEEIRQRIAQLDQQMTQDWKSPKRLLQELRAKAPVFDSYYPHQGGALYALGSWVWGKEPNDLDLIVVPEGWRPYEVLVPFHAEGIPVPVHLRVVGRETLRKAVLGGVVANKDRIRLEAMFVYGSAVLLKGHDVLEETRLPPENLPKLAAYLREKAASVKETPGLTADLA